MGVNGKFFAADGAAGLDILQGKDKIDLLITDVGLPGGPNGRQRPTRRAARRPEVLFIAGYAKNAVLNHGHIARGMEVLTTPFAVEELAGRVERDIEGGEGLKKPIILRGNPISTLGPAEGKGRWGTPMKNAGFRQGHTEPGISDADGPFAQTADLKLFRLVECVAQAPAIVKRRRRH